MKSEYESLKEQITYHSHRYYVLDNPLITDEEYDIMMRRLLEIEALHPEWITPDSPSQKIGGTILDDFTQVEHSVPMQSLQDAFNEEEIYDFERALFPYFQTEHSEIVALLKTGNKADKSLLDNIRTALGEFIKVN